MKISTKLLGVALSSVLCFGGMSAKEHSWKFVATGDATTYAIDSDGSLWSWGWNESGQMGIGGGDAKIATPTQVGSDTDWKFATGGQAYAFFIKEDGTLWAVGDNTKNCQGVGDGASNHKVPTQVGTDKNWQSVACSRFFGHSVLAIKTDGTLWAWGEGEMGALGTGKYNNPATPVQIGTDSDWSQVSVGNSFSIAIKKDGTLWGWGFNENNVLLGNSMNVKTPTKLSDDTDWASVFAVARTAYGIKTDGKLYVWGSSEGKMAGIDVEGDAIDKPTQVTSVEGTVIAVSERENNRYVAVGSNGVATKVYSWGSNTDGALGDGTGVPIDQTGSTVLIPVQVKLDAAVKVTQLAAGIRYCTVLSDDGKIYGWGSNRGGQLGDYSAEDQMTYRATPIVCAVENTGGDNVYTIDASDIPGQLSDAKKLILTGSWNSSSFSKLMAAIGNNSGFPPAGNSSIEEIDMSAAQIEAGTSLYAAYGMSSYGVFRGLSALTKVVMPTAEQSANFKNLRSMFQNCSNLQAIDMTGCSGVTNMEDAFFGCVALKKVDLSKCDKLTSTASMFDKCTSLEEVVLPATITLGKYTFGENTSLRRIDWSLFSGSSVPEQPEELFQYVEDLKAITLVVPASLLDAFKADADWSKLNVVAAAGVDGIVSDKYSGDRDVYTLDGVKVRVLRDGETPDVLPRGIYIIGKQKIFVK